jgi:predicted branched-subunit amino acid permease
MSDARHDFLEGARAISPLIVAGLTFGFVAGAAIAQAGLGIAESVGMSVGTYGASAQLAATLLYEDGAPLLVTIGTALIINARFFVYSASFAPNLEGVRGGTRLLSAYLMRDGAYALAMTRLAREGGAGIVPYYLGAAVTDWVVWLVATLLGTRFASLMPAGWSLDFIVPLVFVALLGNALRGRVDGEAALVAAVAAAVLVPLLPMQTGIIAAILLGMMWGALRE